MTGAIEPLAEREIEALCKLARDIWREHYPAIIGTAQTEYMLAQRYTPAVIRAELERGNVWWDVLHDSGRMFAFSSSFPGDAVGEMKLDKLYVHPGYQRQGFGGLLIEHVCERARTLGWTHVILAVNKRNDQAIDAYHKHGFEIRGSAVTPIGGGFVMDDFVMERQCRR